MAVPLAEVADVEAIWRTLEPSETSQAAVLINIASAKLRARLPFDVDARIALYATTPRSPGALDPMVVANVVATIVKRVLVNPDGLVSTTQTFGPISESRSFVARTPSGTSTGVSATDPDSRGEIRITQADLSDLLPVTRKVKVRSTEVGLQPSMMPPPGIRRGVPGIYDTPQEWIGDDYVEQQDQWPGQDL